MTPIRKFNTNLTIIIIITITITILEIDFRADRLIYYLKMQTIFIWNNFNSK